jgi:hypothetical protein
MATAGAKVAVQQVRAGAAGALGEFATAVQCQVDRFETFVHGGVFSPEADLYCIKIAGCLAWLEVTPLFWVCDGFLQLQYERVCRIDTPGRD